MHRTQRFGHHKRISVPTTVRVQPFTALNEVHEPTNKRKKEGESVNELVQSNVSDTFNMDRRAGSITAGRQTR